MYAQYKTYGIVANTEWQSSATPPPPPKKGKRKIETQPKYNFNLIDKKPTELI
jgi:hypothetical protein